VIGEGDIQQGSALPWGTAQPDQSLLPHGAQSKSHILVRTRSLLRMTGFHPPDDFSYRKRTIGQEPHERGAGVELACLEPGIDDKRVIVPPPNKTAASRRSQMFRDYAFKLIHLVAHCALPVLS